MNSELEVEIDWYHQHANDHIFYFYVDLINRDKTIKADDIKLPILDILNWYKQRFERVISFDIRYEWKLSLFHRKHLFRMSYTPEEMVDFIDLGYEYYILTDLIVEMMDNVLNFAEISDIPLNYEDKKMRVSATYFSGHHNHIGMDPIDRIYILCEEDERKKRMIFEELIPKAWHPTRFQDWCL